MERRPDATPTKAPRTEQLIHAGAFPTAYGAVQLAAEQKPVQGLRQLLDDQAALLPLRRRRRRTSCSPGPSSPKKTSTSAPTGRKTRRIRAMVVEGPGGHDRRLRTAPERKRQARSKRAEPGWYAIKDNPALSGTDITEPEAERTGQGSADRHLRIHRQAAAKPSRKSPARSPSAARRRRSGRSAPKQAEALSGHFAVVLDNEVKTRPIINFAENPDGIDGRTGAQISGGFNSISEAQELATTLQIGALPINLKLISQTQVSATLGTQALHDGIKAGIIGLALVILFLLLFYRFLGLIATVALGAYGVIFFALIKLIPITLTLPGIAGLILTIGVAADSNIVIFERIKEEVRAGRSMSSAIAAGYRRGIATIVDANVVTLLTAFILFVLATAGVKGFAFTLGVGTIVSLLTAVVFTQALLGSMSRTRLLRSPSVLGAGRRERSRWHFDFMGASRWFFTLSG